MSTSAEDGARKYKTLAANTALISFGTLGSKLLVFFMVRFYTGYMSPSDYGPADIITQTANLLIPLVTLGMAEGVFRFSVAAADALSALWLSVKRRLWRELTVNISPALFRQMLAYSIPLVPSHPSF